MFLPTRPGNMNIPINLYRKSIFQYFESSLRAIVVAMSGKPQAHASF